MSTVSMSSLLDRNVFAADGEVGTLHDIYFSDDTWRVEHFILQTGHYFQSRRLIMEPRLVLPEAGHGGGGAPSDIRLDATRKEILASPDYLTDPPVSEQRAHDPALHPRFLWFPTGDTTKIVLRPLGAGEEAMKGNEAETIARGLNPHLQSFREVRGYAVHPSVDADDEETADRTCIGHVDDLLIRVDDLRIEQVIIDTGHGRSDILSVQPGDVKRIDWADVHLYLRRTRAELGLPVG